MVAAAHAQEKPKAKKKTYEEKCKVSVWRARWRDELLRDVLNVCSSVINRYALSCKRFLSQPKASDNVIPPLSYSSMSTSLIMHVRWFTWCLLCRRGVVVCPVHYAFLFRCVHVRGGHFVWLCAFGFCSLLSITLVFSWLQQHWPAVSYTAVLSGHIHVRV